MGYIEWCGREIWDADQKRAAHPPEEDMPSRRFECEGEEWEVRLRGLGPSLPRASGPPNAPRWIVHFVRPGEPDAVVAMGMISSADPDQVSVAELCGELRRALG